MNGMYLKMLTLSDRDAVSDCLSLAPTMKEVEWIQHHWIDIDSIYRTTVILNSLKSPNFGRRVHKIRVNYDIGLHQKPETNPLLVSDSTQSI